MSVSAEPLVRSRVKSLRLWAVLFAIVIVGAVVVTQLRTGSNRALDPASPGHSGSKALATVLRDYGVHVTTTSDVTGARGRVVVTDPDAYSAAQLRALAAGAQVVLIAPTDRSLEALGLPAHVGRIVSGPTDPLCDWAGARAAGRVTLPGDTIGYATSDAVLTCYEGAVVRGDGWLLLGSAGLLRNDSVGDPGVAALAINAITDDRTVNQVTWLLTGTQAKSQAAPTTWALFPDGARRAFVWLAIIAVLLVLWRAPRFGPVVSEPLPVVVRAAEVVEGHGRLYLRARARARAATALRAGAQQRLTVHLGLPRAATPADVVAATAARTGRDPSVVAPLLGDVPPADDVGLLHLAAALDELEGAAGVPGRTTPDVPIDRSKGRPT
jgi:hypothetical protein